MPNDPIQFGEIESLTPAVDLRNYEGAKTFVLSGRNFMFTSRGPRAFYGNRLLNSGVPLDVVNDSVDVQSVGGFVFTSTQVGRFDAQGEFVPLFTYTIPVDGAYIRRRWTDAFISGKRFFCHPSVGILKYENGSWLEMDYGLLGRPLAITESNGRLIVLTATTLTWSSPSDPEYFAPEIGGAGFQALSTYVAGDPITVIRLPQGCLVWTEGGSMFSEFTGGDTVYRHNAVQNSYRPLSDSSVAQLPDGSYLFCTEQGIHLISGTGTPEKATPIFNEYLRELFRDSPKGGLQVRLDYFAEEDQLFVQIRDWNQSYNHTFVLSVALDKWGSFAPKHRGIISHGISTEPTWNRRGYVDSLGVARSFVTYGTRVEVTPGVFAGLDSYIVLGPFRSRQLQRQVDDLFEVQGIVIGHRSRPTTRIVESTDFNTSDEDDEDYNTSDSANENYGDSHTQLPETGFNLMIISDLGAYDEVSDDPSQPDLELVQVEIPELIRDTPHAKHYACLSNGIWHKLRLSAESEGQYFHVTFGELTLNYHGRIN